MSFTVPASFSPSSLSQFTTCPLAYRYSYIEHRPQPPQISATKGTIVHRALELLFMRNNENRTIENGHKDLEVALLEYSTHPDLVDLHLSDVAYKSFEQDTFDLVNKYFQLEDPTKISPIGIELKLEAVVGDTLVRGVIDRLELDENGELVVTDYKTGSVPRQSSEHSRLAGVHLYALMCESVFGKVPSKVQLLYLSAPTSIIAIPSPSSLRGAQAKSSAVHKAVETACAKGDFPASPSVLCGWCGYHDLCPAQGGKIPE